MILCQNLTANKRILTIFQIISFPTFFLQRLLGILNAATLGSDSGVNMGRFQKDIDTELKLCWFMNKHILSFVGLKLAQTLGCTN